MAANGRDLALKGAAGAVLAELQCAGLVPVTVTADDRTFKVTARLDTPREADYYRHGGIMPFVLRGLLADRKE